MIKEEQIEEMAKCCTYFDNGKCCADVTNITECDLMCEMFGVLANLEMAGYRKADEVRKETAKEIFEKIEKLTYRLLNDKDYVAGDLMCDNEIKDLVKGLRIGFDNEMEYVFDETLEKINEITNECYEEIKE